MSIRTSETQARLLELFIDFSRSRFGTDVVRPVDRPGVDYSFFVGEGPEYVVKYYDGSGPKLENEAFALDCFRSSGVPLPNVVLFDSSRSFVDRDVLVLEYVAHNPAEELSAHDLGVTLRRLHCVELGGAGYLLAGRGQDGNWSQFLNRFIRYYAREFLPLLEQEVNETLNRVDSLRDFHTLLHFD